MYHPFSPHFCCSLQCYLSLSQAQYVAKHIFSIDDVIGDFDGTTYADDKTIMCGLTGSPPCPEGIMPINEDGTLLYPIASEFGFEVADFLGAEEKERIGDGSDSYTEGFAGNIMESDQQVGLRISNVETDLYKTPARYGPWCRYVYELTHLLIDNHSVYIFSNTIPLFLLVAWVALRLSAALSE